MFINEAMKVNDKIYLASYSAAEFDLTRFQISEIYDHRIDSFINFKGEIYGTSDDNGLINLSRNWVSYLPSQFMLPIVDKDLLLFFSDDSIGSIKNEEESLKWKCNKLSFLDSGYSVKSGIYFGDRIFLAGEDGSIFELSLKEGVCY